VDGFEGFAFGQARPLCSAEQRLGDIHGGDVQARQRVGGAIEVYVSRSFARAGDNSALSLERRAQIPVTYLDRRNGRRGRAGGNRRQDSIDL
jgi:hypothetical protein